jgi:hypothetical protein
VFLVKDLGDSVAVYEYRTYDAQPSNPVYFGLYRKDAQGNLVDGRGDAVDLSTVRSDGFKYFADGVIRYFVDGKAAYAGVIRDDDGYLYYISSDKKLVRSCKYDIGAGKTNGLIPVGHYLVDENGRLMDGNGTLLRVDTALANGYKHFANGVTRYYIDGKPVFLVKDLGDSVAVYEYRTYDAQPSNPVYFGLYRKDEQGNLVDGRGDAVDLSTVRSDGFKYFADGVIRYFVDGKAAYVGLIKDENGHLYYIGSARRAVCGIRYSIGTSKANGLLPAGRYNFDPLGRLMLDQP